MFSILLCSLLNFSVFIACQHAVYDIVLAVLPVQPDNSIVSE